jgi:dynein heavy chain
MDDNKVLTLVSQERIPLTPEMRLILEVSNLKHATPATVSRGGVLFINDVDVGTRPYIETWLQKYKSEEKVKNDDKLTAHASFILFLNQYCTDNFIDDLHHREQIAPVCDMGSYQTLTTIIDYEYERIWGVKENQEYMKRMKEEEDYIDKYKVIYEGIFAFAFMWAFGATLSEDKIVFNGTVRSTSKVKFPEGGSCFDYRFDIHELAFVPWADSVPKFNSEELDQLFPSIVVATAETVRQKYILDVHKQA